jgi:serum/glucocorticoid-regulated kinase 2
MANNNEFKLPDKKYLKIVNLDQYNKNNEEETARKTELRKRTTMLYKKGKKDQGDLCIEDFYMLKVLGRGAFGKVVLSKKKDTKKIYAIKILRKQTIIDLE